MFWEGICRETLIGPFMVVRRIKMNSEEYADYLAQHFFNENKYQPRSSKLKFIYIHDNAQSFAS